MRFSALRRHRAVGSRAGWTVADQAVSSIVNAGLSILVARSVDAAAFGAFTVAFVAFTFVIGISRTWIVDPLVIRFSGREAARELSGAAAACAGASLVAGVAAGVVSAGTGLLVGGPVGSALVALGVGLPALLVQDVYRHAAFAARRPQAATVNDVVWAVVLFSSAVVLVRTGTDSVVMLLLVWGGGAAAGALAGVLQFRVLPRPLAARAWLTEHRQLGSRLGFGFILNMGAVNLTVFLVGAVAGLAAAGSLRAAQTLVGPLQALLTAGSSLVVPTLSGRIADGRHVGLRPALVVSGLLSSVAVVWVGLLLLLPREVGEALLGDSWEGARQVMPGIGGVAVMSAVSAGAGLVLKASGQASRLLRNMLVQSPLILLLGSGGALLAGAPGAAVGFFLAHLVGTTVMWLALRSHLRHRPAVAGP